MFFQNLKNIFKKPFSKKIEFHLLTDRVGFKDAPLEDFYLEPVPAKKLIPDWYKSMKTFNRGPDTATVKKCPPVLEMLTHGFYIVSPCDILIEKADDGEGQVIFQHQYPPNFPVEGEAFISSHARQQVWAMPIIDKWKAHHALKFNNPFLIKTPPGYSTMFLNPKINDYDDEIYTFEAIVDTDKWHEINFPFVINWNKLKIGEGYVLKRGQPIVLCVPFKRNNWDMVCKINPDKDLITKWKSHLHLKGRQFSNYYKDLSTRIKFK